MLCIVNKSFENFNRELGKYSFLIESFRDRLYFLLVFHTNELRSKISSVILSSLVLLDSGLLIIVLCIDLSGLYS